MNSRHPFHSIILATWFLGVCAAPWTTWGQTPTINKVRQIRVEREGGKTVISVPGTLAVNFTAFANATPPQVVLELASTWFEDTATPLEVEDWTVASVALSNHGKTGQTKGRVTVFLARKAGYQVVTKDRTVRLILTPDQAPPPSTEEATARLALLRKQAAEMEGRIQEAQATAEKLRLEREKLEREGTRQKTNLSDARKSAERMAAEQEEARRQLASLARSRDAIATEMKTLQGQLAQAKENEEKARARLDELKTVTKTMETQREKSRAELEKTTRELNEELARRKLIEKEIETARAEIETLRKQAGAQSRNGQKLTQEARERLAALEKGVANSERKLSTAQAQVREMESRRAELLRQVDLEEQKLKTMRANAELENRKLTSEIADLRRQAGELQGQKEKLRRETDELTARRDSLQQAVEKERQMQASLEAARLKSEELQKKAARLAAEEQERATVLEKRRRSIETLLAREKDELAMIQVHKGKEQQSLTQLKTARAEHQKLLTQEETQKEKMEREGQRQELARLKERQRQRETEIARLEKQAARWEKAAREGETEIRNLGGRLAKARGELEEARTRYDAASRELIQISQARDEARGQLREINARLEGLSRQTAAEKRRLAELTTQLSERERQLKSTEARLTENRAALETLERKQAAKEKEFQELTVSARALADRVKQDQENLRQLDARKTQIQAELDTLKARKGELEKAVRTTSKAGTLDPEEVRRRAAQVTELEARKRKLEQDLATLDETRETLRRLETEKLKAQAELTELERKRVEVGRQLDEMNRRKTTQGATAKLKQERENEVRALEARRAELEKELARLAERKVATLDKSPAVVTPRPAAAPAVTPGEATLVEHVEFVDSPWSHHVVLRFSAAPGPETLSQKGDLWTVTFSQGQFRQDLRRNMDTASYQGPVSRVLTFNRAIGKTPNAVVEIHTTGSRTVQVRRNGASVLILVPKTVAEVRRYQKTSMPPSEVGSYVDTRTAVKNLPAAPTSPRKGIKPAGRTGTGGSGGYSGRFVDLDFKDADLHNVIRLVAEVWGKNVVIPDDVKGTITIKLTNVRVDRAFDVILKSKSLDWVNEGGNIIRIATLDQLGKEREEMLARTKTEVRMIPTETRLIPINYANVEDIAKTIESNVMSSRGKVTFDKRTNVIIYVDVPSKIKVAQELVRSLDLPTPQVQIEARIVEAETTFLREIGVQWGGSLLANSASGNPTGLIFPSNVGLAGGNMDTLTKTGGISSAGAANPDFAVNLPASTGSGAGGALGMTLGSLSGAVNINLRLSAMEEIGHVRSIAAPKITTLDNVEAKISQGVEIPYPQSSAQGNTVIMKQAVLSLSVTPHVTNDNMVQMKIEVTKDEPDLTNRGADGSLGISKKSAKTELLVKSGDTAVIGGIYKRQSTLIYRKVPWFADIPIVGWLFKNQYKKDTRSELLIFITPRVLNRSGIITKD
jgi:type IV pilus assembly protein PilQ